MALKRGWLLAVLILVLGCIYGCTRVPKNNQYLAGFDYESKKIRANYYYQCNAGGVNLLALLDRLRPQIKQRLIETNRNDMLGVLDYKLPAYLGIKKIRGVEHVKYTFTSLVVPLKNLRSVGGVNIVAKLCEEELVYVYFYYW